MQKDYHINPVNLSIIGASATVICFGLNATKFIVIPLFIAFIFYCVSNSVVSFLESKVQFPKKVYSLIILLLFITLASLTINYFFSSLTQVISELNFLSDGALSLLTKSIEYLERLFPNFKIKALVHDQLSIPIGKVIGSSSTFLKGFIQILILSLVTSLFFIIDPFSINQYTRNRSMINLEACLRRYFLIKFFSSLLTSLIVVSYLAIIDQRFLLFVGVLTFILNFIPSFGSIISTLLLIPILAIQTESVETVVLYLIFPTALQFIIGNIIEPKLMGKSLKLSPITVIFSLIFWGIIFGVYGLFLAIPLSLAIIELKGNLDLRKYLIVNNL